MDTFLHRWKSLVLCCFWSTLPARGLESFELTDDNWDVETAGKMVFIDYFAPMCGGCMELAPHFHRLIADYKDSLYSGLYTVDCHGSGASLCQEAKVAHTPALLYGNASAGKKGLKLYSGGHKYKELKAFAKKVLGPVCSLSSLKHCSQRDRELVTQFSEMSENDLQQEATKLQQDAKEKELALKSRKKTFEEEQDVFEADLKEFKSEKKFFVKSGKKLERKSGKPVTDQERAKHEQSKAKMQAKAEELETRRQKLSQDRESLQQERRELDVEVRNSGLRIMQAIFASRKEKASEEL